MVSQPSEDAEIEKEDSKVVGGYDNDVEGNVMFVVSYTDIKAISNLA